jgi:hypothetical protein
VQRVVPTIRSVTPSIPVTSGANKYPEELFNPANNFSEVTLERGTLFDGESDRDGALNPMPKCDSTNLLFAEGRSDRLASTPITTKSIDFVSESDTPQLCSRFSELESQLKIQTDINRELKRLLVASMGNDLQYRLNQIAKEKATISQNLDVSLNQLAENHEEIDRIAIECDIWRSKFLASRLMVDELASWKAEVTRQLRDSQRALQCMLKEGTELGGMLLQCGHCLEEIVMHLRLKGREEECGRYKMTN